MPYTATITVDAERRLTDRSTITILDADGSLVDAAQVLVRAAVGGRLAPRRIAETLRDMGYRQVSDLTDTDDAVVCDVSPTA